MQRSEAERVAQNICAAAGYTYKGFLGEGAFKFAFKIEDGGTAKALKVYKSQTAATNARTQGEIDALTRCDHPGIVKYDGSPLRLWTDSAGQRYAFSIEEYLGGSALDAMLRNGLLSRTELFDLGRRLIDVIAYLDGMGLVHRDLKPANIMHRASGEPVVVDFGLVRDLTATSKTPTWADRGPGTPFYAAPEQLNNEKDMIDWRTDQFSLAVVLTIAGTGEHPFAGVDMDETVMRVAQRGKPTAAAQQWAAAERLTCLPRMLEAWPVRRFRTPAELQVAWAQQ